LVAAVRVDLHQMVAQVAAVIQVSFLAQVQAHQF
jgi:hypothetical protein